MNPDRIVYLAQNALGGFDTLDIETAADLAQSDLRDILRELGALRLHVADDAILVPLIKPTE